jgi:hypothetical protein
LIGEGFHAVGRKLWLRGEEGVERGDAIGFGKGIEIRVDDLGVAWRELAGKVEFVVGGGMAGEELIDATHAVVAACGAGVDCEGPCVRSSRFGNLSGAEEDVAGESLNLGGVGFSGECGFRGGESLLEFILRKLCACEARVGCRRRRVGDLGGVESFGALSVAGYQGAEGFSGSWRWLNRAVDFAVGGVGCG